MEKKEPRIDVQEIVVELAGTGARRRLLTIKIDYCAEAVATTWNLRR